MYSEDKKMLMSTLKGIQENVQNMILNQTPPDQITVVVVQDGIEKMDSSIVDYFEEAQIKKDIKSTAKNAHSTKQGQKKK